MIEICHINSLWKDSEFKNCSKKYKIEKLYEKYEDAIEKKYQPKWEENWEKSLPLVEKLVDYEYKITKFLHVYTTRGIPIYNETLLNLTDVKHNQEFIILLLAIGRIWQTDFLLNFNKNKYSSTPAIRKFVSEFFEEFIEYDESKVVFPNNDEFRYFMLDNNVIKENGTINMKTTSEIIKAIVF